MPGPLTISQMTSLVTLVGPEIFPCVSPGNNTATNANYGVTANQIAALALISFPPTTANFVFAGPTSGATAVPAFRGLVNADLPLETGLSVVGVAGTASTSPVSIVGTTDQVLRIAQTGTSLSFGPINLATSAAVTGILPVSNGGIGTTTLSLDGLLIGNGSNAVGVVAATTAGFPLIAQGSASVPAYQALNLATANVTGQLPVTFGGIGTSALASHGVALAQGSAAFAVAGATTAGYPLVSNGSTANPGFQATNLASTFVTGILGVVSGGISTSSLPVDAVLLGNGTSGLSVVTATTAGLVLTSQGSTLAPQWSSTGAGTLTNVTTAFGLTGGPISTVGTISISTTAPPYGVGAPINLGLSASILTGVLTINFLTNAGGTPTATSPILVPFRNPTLGTGSPVWATISGALSMSTFTTGAGLGTVNSSVPFRLWLTLFYQNATTLMPALINCVNGTTQIFPLSNALQTTVAIGSTAASAGVFYSPNGTSVGNAPFCIAGYIEYASGLATAGTFTTLPTILQVYGVGIARPGDVVQRVFGVFNTSTVIQTTIITRSSVTSAITPTSAANLVKIEVAIGMYNATGAIIFSGQTYRSTVASSPSNPVGNVASLFSSGGTTYCTNFLLGLDAPGTTVSTQYGVYGFVQSAGGNGALPFSGSGVTPAATIALEEIMG